MTLFFKINRNYEKKAAMKYETRWIQEKDN